MSILGHLAEALIPIIRIAGISEKEADALSVVTGASCPRGQAVLAVMDAEGLGRGAQPRIIAERILRIGIKALEWEENLGCLPREYEANMPMNGLPYTDIRLAFHFAHASENAATTLLRVLREAPEGGAWILRLCGYAEIEHKGVRFTSSDMQYYPDVTRIEEEDQEYTLLRNPWFEWINDKSGDAICEPFDEIATHPAAEVLNLADLVGSPVSSLYVPSF